MKQIFFVLALGLGSLFVTSVNAQKGFILPPPSFAMADGSQAIFVNILWSRTTLVFDVEKKVAEAYTQFEFQNWDEGHPLFDLIPDPDEVTLDGERIRTKVIQVPGGATKVRMMETPVTKGNHLVTVRHKINKNIKFRDNEVAAGFWYSDLDDREFLEQYLPTNLEFDTYFMVFRVKVIGASSEHLLLTNGLVTKMDENDWQVSYPEFYNCSSVFFHLGASSTFEVQTSEFASANGKKLPVIVYSKAGAVDVLESFSERAHLVLTELERDYGAFPHRQLLIYANQSFNGGMEYAGATITNLWALAHEITHSYFGRSIMPANGNAGWIDEAIASWRDARYPRLDDPGYNRGNLARFSAYRRSTTGDAYTKGRNFIGYLDGLMAQKGQSMKAFLKDLVAKRSYEPISTPFFKKWIEESYGANLDDDFSQYVLNGEANLWDDDPMPPRSPFHPKLTDEMLERLL